MFECDMCGECCRNLDLSPVYAELHNGDGICKYLKGNICSIYDNRPLLCRVDESYDVYFSRMMDREEFYLENKKVCKQLKENRRRK